MNFVHELCKGQLIHPHKAYAVGGINILKQVQAQEGLFSCHLIWQAIDTLTQNFNFV